MEYTHEEMRIIEVMRLAQDLPNFISLDIGVNAKVKYMRLKLEDSKHQVLGTTYLECAEKLNKYIDGL